MDDIMQPFAGKIFHIIDIKALESLQTIKQIFTAYNKLSVLSIVRTSL